MIPTTHRTYHRVAPLSVLLALGLCACVNSNAKPGRFDPTLLRGVPQVQRELINVALKAMSAARRAYGNSGEQTEIAGESVEQARKELNVVTNRVSGERMKLAAAQRKDDPARLAAVKAEYIELLGIGRIARFGLALSRREHELAALQERLCLEELRLADARVEVARAMAVAGLDNRATDSISLEDRRENAGFHEREVAVADRRLSDARARMTQARADFEGAINALHNSEQAAR